MRYDRDRQNTGVQTCKFCYVSLWHFLHPYLVTMTTTVGHGKMNNAIELAIAENPCQALECWPHFILYAELWRILC